MTDFLLELLSEEIPARMQARARADLARLFAAELAAAGLAASAIETYSTPRRLALIARGLPGETAPVREERRGPRADAPEQAIAGFLGATGLARDQLETRQDKKGALLYAIIQTPGRPTRDVLAEAVPRIVRDFPWPKSMRWGEGSLRWVRPLQGIVALFGDEVVPFEIEKIISGAATVGHRFRQPGPITIGSANDYAEKLRACHVVLDHEERATTIRDRARALAEGAGLELVEDDALVVENAALTEWPVPLLGSFDEAFLDLPPEVITLTMRTNQKCFALKNPSRAGEELAPNFICTANIDAADGGASIVAGNRKVLAARLADAKFFWEQDLKTPLAEHAKKLDQIVFHEKLGTVADKVERVAKLARWLVEEGIVTEKPLPFRGGVGGGASPQTPSPADTPHPNPSPKREGPSLADLAETAARLCKADLVTQMVGEFPELQGVIGGYYAAAQGLDPRIAAAIRDHYKPAGQGDEAPTAPVTVAVSLADKLDTLVGFFGIEYGPTGSRDPYALRRAALGVISLLVDNDIRLRLLPFHAMALHDHVYRHIYAEMRKVADDDALALIRSGTSSHLVTSPEYRQKFLSQPEVARFVEAFGRSDKPLIDFLADRLKVQQREAGVRHDLIDAVFALGGEDDLVRLLARVRALQAFVETEDGANLLAGYKRAANILKKEGWRPPLPAREGQGAGSSPQSDLPSLSAPTPDPSLSGRGEKKLSYTREQEENDLIAALDSAEPAAAAAIEAEDFAGAMAALASLRAPIDAFFEKVTVNDPDPAKREARLALLARVRDAVHRVADFSRIEG